MADNEVAPTDKHKDDGKPIVVIVTASILIGALIGTGLYILGSKKPFGK